MDEQELAIAGLNLVQLETGLLIELLKRWKQPIFNLVVSTF